MESSSISRLNSSSLASFISIIENEKDQRLLSNETRLKLVQIANRDWGIDPWVANCVFRGAGTSGSDAQDPIIFAYLNQALVTVYNTTAPKKLWDLMELCAPQELRIGNFKNIREGNIHVLAQKTLLGGDPSPCYVRSQQGTTDDGSPCMSIKISTPQGGLIAESECAIRSTESGEKYLEVSFGDEERPNFIQPEKRNVWAEVVMFKAMKYAMTNGVPSIIVQPGTPLEQTAVDLGFIPLLHSDSVQNGVKGMDDKTGSARASLSGDNGVEKDSLRVDVNEENATIIDSRVKAFWSFR